MDVRNGLTLNGIEIYNNTIYAPYGSGSVADAAICAYETDGTMSGLKIKNNICYDDGADYFVTICAACQPGLQIDYNDYFIEVLQLEKTQLFNTMN